MVISSEPGVAEASIISYNAIEQMVMKGMEKHPDVTLAVVKDASFNDCIKADMLVRLIQSSKQGGQVENGKAENSGFGKARQRRLSAVGEQVPCLQSRNPF